MQTRRWIQATRGKSRIPAAMILALALTGVLLAPGCDRSGAGTPDEAQALELRSYAVPGEYASEVSSIVNSLLQRGDEAPPAGKARIGPGGFVLVVAPASVQEGVAKLIADLEGAKPEPPPTVALTYWAVVGRPSADVSWPSPLGEIGSALEAVTDSDGPMTFSLLEKLRIQSLSGEWASVRGRRVQLRQTATARDGSVLGKIYIAAPHGRTFETQVQMGLDQLLVLGQTGFAGDIEPEADSDASLYYIVKASLN